MPGVMRTVFARVASLAPTRLALCLSTVDLADGPCPRPLLLLPQDPSVSTPAYVPARLQPTQDRPPAISSPSKALDDSARPQRRPTPGPATARPRPPSSPSPSSLLSSRRTHPLRALPRPLSILQARPASPAPNLAVPAPPAHAGREPSSQAGRARKRPSRGSKETSPPVQYPLSALLASRPSCPGRLFPFMGADQACGARG